MLFCSVISGKAPSRAYTANDGQFPGVDTTTFTFTSKAIGTADPTRLVIVGLSYIDTAARTATVTVGGTSATEIAACANRTTSGGSTEVEVRFFAVSVATGTTANIVVTISGAGARGCYIGVWAAYDLLSTTAVATSTSTSGTSSISLNLNVSDSGLVFGYTFFNAAVTWTGLTEDFDAAIAGLRHSGASYNAGAAESPRTVSCAYTGAGSGCIGSAVSYR